MKKWGDDKVSIKRSTATCDTLAISLPRNGVAFVCDGRSSSSCRFKWSSIVAVKFEFCPGAGLLTLLSS